MSEFHFIEPFWLLALIPLGLLLWLAWRADAGASAWQRVIDARLLAVLKVGAGGRASRLPVLLLAAGWLIAVVALANPTFERQPVPAFRSDAARVVVLDLSRSMLAEDLTPSRLERARFKVADILSRSGDGQVGLIVYADDAFAVSPLTDDAETIRAMLEALSPQIMPVQGSRPDRGIALGLDLLRQAGARNGEVILLSDDAGGARTLAMAEQVRDAGHSLAVIGVGTAEGAPVPGITTADGPVMSRLDSAALETLAAAGAGRYATLSSSDRDLDQVLIDPEARPRALAERDPMLAERWRELGPWVAVLLLPIAALAFRRGWLMMLLLAFGPGVALVPEPALAFGWTDLWQRQDQQAARAFAAGELEQARALAKAPARAGSAAYRLGNYQDAAARFEAGDTAVDHYNRGNALALGGELEAALAAYDEALARDPTLEDARYNREQVQAALRAQSQQPDQPNQSDQRQDQPQDQSEAQPSESGQQSQNGESQGEDSAEQRGDSSSGAQGDQQGEEQSSGAQQAGDQQADDQQSGDQQAGDQSASAQPGSDSSSTAGQRGPDQNPSPNEAADTQANLAGAESDTADAAAGGDSSQDPMPQADAAADRARSEQAAADYRDEAARAQAAQNGDAPDQEAARTEQERSADANVALSSEEREAQQAADQWLRRIPDDPAELLRRKFLYQYQACQDGADLSSSGKPW
ncbi:VWA domain-containing protein [Lamprobacter modestohalophilus]|nr:VWA domain-containing protein [Lamprobacter modestohalophilus]